jgi:hypothetical protein
MMVERSASCSCWSCIDAGNASYAVWGRPSWALNSFTTHVIKKLINRIDTVDAANLESKSSVVFNDCT